MHAAHPFLATLLSSVIALVAPPGLPALEAPPLPGAKNHHATNEVEYQIVTKAVVKDFRLGSLFNSGMVLQRDARIPVWGRAKAGEKVDVEFLGQKVSTIAAGRWQVILDPVPATGFADPGCPPTTVYAAFNALPIADKKIYNDIHSGHTITPSAEAAMIEAACAHVSAMRAGSGQ